MTTIGRVLVVDDDRDIVESVSIRLHAAGYEIVTAFDGQQGVTIATTDAPDAIVLDVRMPKMDGMTALAQIKQHRDTQCIPVVMLSASMYDQEAALRAGASFFVLKPYVPNYLLAAVDSAIHSGTHSSLSHEPTPALMVQSPGGLKRFPGSQSHDRLHTETITTRPRQFRIALRWLALFAVVTVAGTLAWGSPSGHIGRQIALYCGTAILFLWSVTDAAPLYGEVAERNVFRRRTPGADSAGEACPLSEKD